MSTLRLSAALGDAALGLSAFARTLSDEFASSRVENVAGCLRVAAREAAALDQLRRPYTGRGRSLILHRENPGTRWEQCVPTSFGPCAVGNHIFVEEVGA